VAIGTARASSPCGTRWPEGLTEGDGGSHLKTYHPSGGQSSSAWFQNAAWLDFNMMQSSHGAKDIPNDLMIDKDYARTPTKPVLDGELRYENHPVNWKPLENGWFDAFDVRQGTYWSVFAGGWASRTAAMTSGSSISAATSQSRSPATTGTTR
jgi:hypothetical protein